MNCFCFVIITCCYLIIIFLTKRSSQKLMSHSSQSRPKSEHTMQRKIMVIIATDFVCWMPFILISALHNLDYIDASTWYVQLAMTVLPLNSVINPLVYDQKLNGIILRKCGWIKACLCNCAQRCEWQSRRSWSGIGGTVRNYPNTKKLKRIFARSLWSAV